MNGRLEDAENRITHMKQIHDQQNKKIREIDEEKVNFEIEKSEKIRFYFRIH